MPRKVFKNPDRITCPNCNATNIGLAGFTNCGFQIYLCKDCKKRFTLNPLGRPLVGDKPLTSTERSRRQYAKEKRLRGKNKES